MKPFTYDSPADADTAVRTVAADPSAVFLAGGTNLVDHLKLGVARPGRLVDVTHLTSTEITERDGLLSIGAGVRNSDLAADPRIRSRYPVLAESLLAGASGQLRNMATTGGNPLQRTRCAYFQDVTTPCNKREPGSGCSAIGGYTRYHAILGASEHCVATHPSDLAVALAALDAEVSVLGPDGERTIPFTELHRLPGDTPERDTVLAHGDLITSIDLPAPPAGKQRYRKVRDRASYAFALVSVAAVLAVEDGTIVDARIAFGGVAHKPWRAWQAEDVLRGAPATEATFRAAAEEELAQARPLPGNEFKVPLLTRTLVSVLRELS
ncbi:MULTISPECIES: FAD binding domain-containing protein [Amycolatopsis]|uniref:Xanthine dehydrogenase YagS FAD-binding subunit n=1 Tax=Amycolatopsis thermoflava TaxID=84480 RepID=A0A3N2GRU8_9PSEU|nr:xanthine dehydrogenase family protein subunit M [Amycolatopsis thermoflava]ROS39090.1 xanthine dehydrogenase YagS FAD-binding subunit [Amycolatopsis thermoflava]